MHTRMLATRTGRLLLAWFTILTLVILASAATYVYLAYQRATSELIIERDGQLAYLSAARLNSELSNYADVLTGLARVPELRSGDPAELQLALRQARFRLAVFDGGVVVLDNFGRLRGAHPARPQDLGSDWSDRPVFGAVLASQDVVFSNAEVDELDGSLAVMVSVPIHGDRGELAGALVGMFRLGAPEVSSFYASIVRLRIGQSGHTYVIDGTRRVLYDSGQSMIGQVFAEHNLSPVNGRGAAFRTLDAEGNAILAAHAPIPGTPWTLVTEDDWATLTRSTQRYSAILFSIFGLGVLLPAIGVVLLVRHRGLEMEEHEHHEYDAQAAEMVRHSLLPKNLPVLPGWSLAMHYRASHDYGGDFFDFLFLPDGRLMLSMGDLTNDGVQAALGVATIRTTLRSATRHMLSPCEALEATNELIYPELQPGVEATCVYALLDPASSELAFSNAGPLLPNQCSNGSAEVLGTPSPRLGAELETQYEQHRVDIRSGECIAFYSDGLVEAQNAEGISYGLPRLQSMLTQEAHNSQEVVDAFLDDFNAFTGPGRIPEDDVTLLVLMRTSPEAAHG